MATGFFSADLAATTNTTLATVTASTTSVGTINLTNRNATSVLVRIAIAAAGAPGNGEYIEYDLELTPKGTPGATYNQSGIIAQAGKNIVVYSDTANVSAAYWHIEE